MRKINIIILSIIALSFIAGICLYPRMPDMMVSHWGAGGEANGYMPKFFGLFLMPIVALACFILFLAIPGIDPMKKNIAKFRNYYDNFILLFEVFLFYIFLLTLCWNLGYKFSMNLMIIPAIGIIIYYAGVLIENARQNWFIGIRTPWTLSSKEVWKKTHRLGSRMFKASGIIALIGISFQENAIWFALVPVLFSAVYLLFYSYFEYRKRKA